MKTYRDLFKSFLLFVLVGLFLASGCAEGEVQRMSRTVERDDAAAVRAEVTMLSGQMDVRGGATALLDAEFVYNIESWEPFVDYTVNAGQGRLRVQQPVTPDVRVSRVRYEWELAFANDVPLDLRVTLGAGKNDLHLSGMHLSNLEVTLGAGETTLDLTGMWPQSFDVRVRGGAGQANIQLPRDVGVRVEAGGVLGQLEIVGLRRQDGAYVNDAYGQSDVTLNVDVQGGVGELVIQVGE